MKSLTMCFFSIFFSVLSIQVQAHIDWGTIDGMDCSRSLCINDPLEFKVGQKIDVVYNVEIVHGEPVSIVFKKGEQSFILKDNLAEKHGLNSSNVILPNEVCADCRLEVTAAGYKGSAFVVLTNQADMEPVSNVAPEVSLEIIQDGEKVTWVSPTKGMVWVKAIVTDANTNDTHSYDWMGTDNRLVDQSTDNAAMLSFDPISLADGSYDIQLSVSDDGEPAMSDTAILSLMVSVELMTTTPNDSIETNAPNKKGGSVDVLLLLLGVASALYCIALYVFGVRKAPLNK